MQIRTGSCSVTNGESIVIASDGNDWSQAAPNCLFSIPAIDGSSVLYVVATVTTPGLSDSGFWELALTANYAGDTAAAVAYQITKDFTPTLGIPILHYGDTDTAILINRGLLLLEAAITGVVAAEGAIPFLGTFAGFTAADADGGTHTDSVATTALTTGIFYCFDRTEASNPGAKILKLNAGTDAPDLPGKYRPLDYNASTNAKYWTIR